VLICECGHRMRVQKSSQWCLEMKPGHFLLGLLLLVILALAALPTLLYPLTRDQGAYSYMADLMMKGGVPYRDAWDLKPPAIYWLYLLAFQLFGRSEFAVRLFDVLYTLLSAASIYLLANEVFSDRRVAALSAWTYAFCYCLLLHFYAVANPESFVVPFLALMAYGVVRSMRRHRHVPMLISGIAGGLSFWFKPTAGVVVLGMLAWALAVMWRERRTMDEALRSLAVLAAGGLLGLVPVGLYLYGRGLQELLELWRVYGTGAYLGARGLALGEGPLAVLDVIMGYARDWQLLVWLSLTGVVALCLERRRNPAGLAVVVLLLANIAVVFLQGKLFEYHWIPAFAPAAILSATSLTQIWDEWRSIASSREWGSTSMTAIFAVVVVAGLLLWTGYDHLARYRRTAAYLCGRMTAEQYDAQFDIGQDFSRTGTQRAAMYLRDHTRPNETAMVWGAEPLVNFLAERRSPTKYIFSYMLAGQGRDPNVEARRLDLLRELQNAPPAYIVLVENDAHPLTPYGSRAMLEEFASLRELLESGYSFEAQVEDYLFYRRN
jgi:4-amino-4-deoxy-L-arabinose transferase-like glycosyltransferase